MPGLLRGAGISLVRVPGGSESDQYDWKTNTDVIGNFREAVDFGQFMSVIRQARAQAMVTVDYGTGNTIGQQDGSGETGPQIAADWVRYANIQHHYGIKYWEIGNEVYGNGTYGADWEADDALHDHPGWRPGRAGQRAGPDLQLRPGRVRGQRGAVHRRDEGGQPAYLGRRRADRVRRAEQLAGRRDQRADQPRVVEPDRSLLRAGAAASASPTCTGTRKIPSNITPPWAD